MGRNGDLYRRIRAEDVGTGEERGAGPADGPARRQDQSHGLAAHSVSESDVLMHVHVVEWPLPRAALELSLRDQAVADGFRAPKRPAPQATRNVGRP